MNTFSSIKFNQDIYDTLTTSVHRNLIHYETPIIILSGLFGSGKSTLLRNSCISIKKEGYNAVWLDGRTLFQFQQIIEKFNNEMCDLLYIDDIDFLLSRADTGDINNLIELISISKKLIVCSTTIPVFSVPTKLMFSPNVCIFIDMVDINTANVWRDLLNQEQTERANYLMTFLPRTIHNIEEVYNIVKGRRGYDLVQLIENHSEYYLSLYNGLSGYAQNILNALANNKDGITMSQLRQITGLTTNILSSYLNILRRKNIIGYSRKGKGQTLYMVSDPLFRKWLMVEPISKV